MIDFFKLSIKDREDIVEKGELMIDDFYYKWKDKFKQEIDVFPKNLTHIRRVNLGETTKSGKRIDKFLDTEKYSVNDFHMVYKPQFISLYFRTYKIISVKKSWFSKEYHLQEVFISVFEKSEYDFNSKKEFFRKNKTFDENNRFWIQLPYFIESIKNGEEYYEIEPYKESLFHFKKDFDKLIEKMYSKFCDK